RSIGHKSTHVSSTKIAYKFENPEYLVGTLFMPPSSTRIASNPFRAVMFSAQGTGNIIYRVGKTIRS
ncbi:unnamed protein product, partial [Callosobruchus maculatus]